jgi:hypothetical protein
VDITIIIINLSSIIVIIIARSVSNSSSICTAPKRRVGIGQAGA